jgi:hypothetical protein
MAVPRPILIALIGVLVIAGIFLALSASDDDSADDTEFNVPAQPAASGDGNNASGSAGGQGEEAVQGVPPEVETAINRKQVVVLFFGQRGGADDRAVRRVVGTLENRRRISVFTDDVKDIADYRRVTGSLSVSQAPAIVIVQPDKEASVIEGFTDQGTLRQEILDRLRT